MVALDRDGRPAPVPPLEPETPDEIRRQREAEVRRNNRLSERESIRASRDGGAS
jgi:acyl-CoA hydrolase